MAVTLSTNALTTTTALEDRLGIATGTQDDRLNRLINYVSDRVENYLNRKVYYQEDIEEYVSGYGTQLMNISRTPVISIDSIEYDGSAIETGSYEIHDSDTGVLIRIDSTWLWTTANVQGIVQHAYPGWERKLYKVTYTGGWITQKQDDDDVTLTRNLPWDIEEACLMTCESRYAREGTNLNVTSEKLMSWAASYGGVSSDAASAAMTAGFPPEAYQILCSYRRVPIVA